VPNSLDWRGRQAGKKKCTGKGYDFGFRVPTGERIHRRLLKVQREGLWEKTGNRKGGEPKKTDWIHREKEPEPTGAPPRETPDKRQGKFKRYEEEKGPRDKKRNGGGGGVGSGTGTSVGAKSKEVTGKLRKVQGRCDAGPRGVNRLRTTRWKRKKAQVRR